MVRLFGQGSPAASRLQRFVIDNILHGARVAEAGAAPTAQLLSASSTQIGSRSWHAQGVALPHGTWAPGLMGSSSMLMAPGSLLCRSLLTQQGASHGALHGALQHDYQQQRGMASSSGAPPTSPAVPSNSLQSRMQAALSLHAGALWQKHKFKVYVTASVLSVWVVWRLTFNVASSFISITTTMAEWGFMGIAVGVVAAIAQYGRWYYNLNPAAVYRHAMVRLNTSPAALEVGAGRPLLGSELRAYISTGGNLYLSRKGPFRPKFSSKRMQMIFPLHGSERDGLASVEVKRKKGRYVFKLLAVDVRPVTAAAAGSASGAARVFIEGTPAIYERGSALGELRDPFLKAVHLQKQLDKDEELEEEQEDRESAQQAARKKPQQSWGTWLQQHATVAFGPKAQASAGTKAPMTPSGGGSGTADSTGPSTGSGTAAAAAAGQAAGQAAAPDTPPVVHAARAGVGAGKAAPEPAGVATGWKALLFGSSAK